MFLKPCNCLNSKTILVQKQRDHPKYKCLSCKITWWDKCSGKFWCPLCWPEIDFFPRINPYDIDK